MRNLIKQNKGQDELLKTHVEKKIADTKKKYQLNMKTIIPWT